MTVHRKNFIVKIITQDYVDRGIDFAVIHYPFILYVLLQELKCAIETFATFLGKFAKTDLTGSLILDY